MITIKSKHEIELMKQSGAIVAKALEAVEQAVKVGVTTNQLDKIAYDVITSMGAKPSFKGYRGFPATVCASVNHEVVHGFPDDRKLKEGDIVGIDVGAILNGYHADAARTFAVGEISPEAKRLIEVTKESFFRGIAQAKHGNRLYDVSATIQEYVEQHGYSVVRDLSGHGIGRQLHEPPDVPNFGVRGRGTRLVSGMTLAIEPMVNEGTFHVFTEANGWTISTVDGKLSAHYENTIVVTDGEPIILTL